MAIFDKTVFVSRLRERYDNLGLIPEDLERFADDALPLKTLRNYFNNRFKKIPTISAVLSLSMLLQTNPEFLLGLSENPEPAISSSFDRKLFIETMRERYREMNLLPMDLELYAESVKLDFGAMRDLLNDELQEEAQIDLLLGLSAILKSSISELLNLKPADKTPQGMKAVLLNKKKRSRKTAGFKAAPFAALTGAGLIIAGSFAPVLRNNDGSIKILFKQPAGTLLALFGLSSLIFASIGNFRLLRIPALANLLAAGWAFVKIRSAITPGQLLSVWAWLLVGAGTFLLLLATILKNDSR